MKIFKLLTFLILINQTINAQTKTLYIQIDTLKQLNNDNFDFQLKVTNQGLFKNGEYFDLTQTLNSKTFPNYTNTIKLLTDSSNIHIPIDQNGSYISISNAYKFVPDTLKISFWEMFETKTLDTNYSKIIYYKRYKGELESKPFKVKSKIRTTKPKSPPKFVYVLINEKKYLLALKLTNTSTILETGHGDKPRNYHGKYNGYKKRTIHLAINSKSIRYSWVGNIDLAEE